MDDPFHYDPAAYHARVAQIAGQVVIDDDALATVAPRGDAAAARRPAPVGGDPRRQPDGAEDAP